MLNVPGDPVRPLSDDGLADKFRRFVASVVGVPETESLLAACAVALETTGVAA